MRAAPGCILLIAVVLLVLVLWVVDVPGVIRSYLDRGMTPTPVVTPSPTSKMPSAIDVCGLQARIVQSYSQALTSTPQLFQ